MNDAKTVHTLKSSGFGRFQSDTMTRRTRTMTEGRCAQTTTRHVGYDDSADEDEEKKTIVQANRLGNVGYNDSEDEDDE